MNGAEPQHIVTSKPISIYGYLYIFVSLLFLFVFNVIVFVPNWNDENTNMYVAEQVATGSVLYKEVPSARPPLALAPPTLLIAAGIPRLFAARASVTLAVLSIAGILFWAGRRMWGATAAFAASGTWIFVSIQKYVFTGINVVALGSTATIVFALARRPWLAGAAAGFALASGQHSAVLVFFAAALFFAREWRDGIKYTACCSTLSTVIYGVVFLVGGEGAWDSLVGNHFYHFKGADVANDTFRGELLKWLLWQMPILLLAASALALRGFDNRSRCFLPIQQTGPVPILTSAVIAHFAVVVAMKGSQILYLHLVIPFLTLLAGAAIQELKDSAHRYEISGETGRGYHCLLVVSAICFVCATGVAWFAQKQICERHDRGMQYSWIPVVQLVQKSDIQDLTFVEQIAEHINSHSAANGTVFGYATIVALVASESDRKVSANLADLPPRWFDMGLVDRSEVVYQIESDSVEFFVTPRIFYTRDRYFQAYLRSCYHPPNVHPRRAGHGRGIPDLLVFQRNTRPRPCLPDLGIIESIPSSTQ